MNLTFRQMEILVAAAEAATFSAAAKKARYLPALSVGIGQSYRTRGWPRTV